MGVILVIALVVAGSTIVVALGDQALRDTERQSDVERAQQAMTLFDSQTAQVALSESDRQTVRLGRTSGTYRVDPTAGELSIINVDRDDDEDNISWTADGYPTDAVEGDDDDDIEYLTNTTLGAVVYESGDTTIAYQGGGVWQQDAGEARMVSPPEFHYRAQTLTLPVVQVVGEGAAAGSARATVSRGDFQARNVYPNASETFSTGDTSEKFLNPVQNGSVIVRIESEYAKGWGNYFEARTDGKVTYPAEDVVAVELISLAQVGGFDMPLEGGSITIGGAAGGHGISRTDPGKTAFSIRLRPDDSDGAKFSNLQWSLYADEGDEEFEMHLKKTGGGDNCKDGSTSLGAHLTIYYSWNDGEDYHGWQTTSPIEAECANLDPSDAEKEIYLDVTFVDDDDTDDDYDENEADDVQLEFQSLSKSDLEHFNPNGDLDESRALDGHSADWEAVSPSEDSTQLSSDQLVNHYFGELPDEFELRVDDKGSDTTNEAASSGQFYNGGSDQYVTYLHVTNNQVEVEVESDG